MVNFSFNTHSVRNQMSSKWSATENSEQTRQHLSSSLVWKYFLVMSEIKSFLSSIRHARCLRMSLANWEHRLELFLLPDKLRWLQKDELFLRPSGRMGLPNKMEPGFRAHRTRVLKSATNETDTFITFAKVMYFQKAALKSYGCFILVAAFRSALLCI